jgi:hypothetical protein
VAHHHSGPKSRVRTEIAAILSTLVETAKLPDVGPSHYRHEAARAGDSGERSCMAQAGQR